MSDYIFGDRFKSICDCVLDEGSTGFNLDDKPKRIFLKTDWIESFSLKILPYIDWSFVLVTHNADRSAPNGGESILTHPNLIGWFSTNTTEIYDKLIPIPIGIANPKWDHGNKSVLTKHSASIPAIKKESIYCNIRMTHYSRIQLMDELKKLDVDIYFDRPDLTFDEYLGNLKQYKFCISPPGNGIDCHRHWESIYVGTVPIILKNLNFRNWETLPILLVDSYRNLQNDISAYDPVGRSVEPASFNFWKEQIIKL